MFFNFFIIILAMMSGFRILSAQKYLELFSAQQLTKFGTMIFVFSVAMSAVFIRYREILMLLVALLLVLLCVLPFAVPHWRERAFRREFPLFLEQVILFIKAGHSFRRAFRLAQEGCRPFFRRKSEDILAIVTFSQQKGPSNHSLFVGEVIKQLQTVDREPSAAVRRLEVVRHRLKIEDDFRRRSGQAGRQVQLQSGILSLMYIALLVFVVHEFEFAKNQKTILLSLLLFVTGMIAAWFLARRTEWKT